MPHDKLPKASEPYFGLGDLSDFTEQLQTKPDRTTIRAIEVAGVADGFIKRENDMPIRLRRPPAGPTTSFFVRLEVSEFNRFTRLMQEARVGRADFLRNLMDTYEKIKS